MLPRRSGRRALLGARLLRDSRGRVVVLALVGALVLTLGIPMVAQAVVRSDAWSPSNWTGEVAGPPVPGTGLPPAVIPNITRAMPAPYDNSPLYEGQSQCDPTAKPGTQAVADLIKATYGNNQTVWIPRACDVGDTSEHKEGRALDWMTTARDPQQRANAEAFLSWLLGPDGQGIAYGNAMRLGVMYIGWNDRIWRGYDIKRGWTELKGCFSSPAPGSDTTCHRNHIHISFTWDGASARNSFWSGNPMNVPYCPTQRATGSVASPGRAGGDPTAVGPVRIVDTRSGAGVPGRCRLAQDRESGDSNRIVAKVLGQGGIPASGVAAVQVTASALGATAPSKLRIWSPGESKSVVVATPGMNQDANGTAIVPVSTDGTIELAISAGSADVVVDVTGFYGPGDTPNATSAKPQSVMAMAGGAPQIPAPSAPKPAGPAAPAPAASTPPAPAAPTSPAPAPNTGPPVDEFTAIGAEVGYESDKDGPLAPGQERVISLNGIPAEATSALVLMTTRQATKPGELRIAKVDDQNAVTAVAFPGNGTRSSVLVVPVTGSRVAMKTTKGKVQVRVEVLGYAVNNGAIKIRGLSPAKVAKAQLTVGKPMEVSLAGMGGLPKKSKWISAVVLRVRTKGKDSGTVKAYPAAGQPPGSRSAPVTPGKPYTSLVVAKVNADGKIEIASSTAAKVTATIVGWVHV